jgi:hypothetical protein
MGRRALPCRMPQRFTTTRVKPWTLVEQEEYHNGKGKKGVGRGARHSSVESILVGQSAAWRQDLLGC